ncbi:hypothetical protein ACS0TY_013698 [Phlomoides rotata]
MYPDDSIVYYKVFETRRSGMHKTIHLLDSRGSINMLCTREKIGTRFRPSQEAEFNIFVN